MRSCAAARGMKPSSVPHPLQRDVRQNLQPHIGCALAAPARHEQRLPTRRAPNVQAQARTTAGRSRQRLDAVARTTARPIPRCTLPSGSIPPSRSSAGSSTAPPMVKPVPTHVAAEAHVIRCHGCIPTSKSGASLLPPSRGCVTAPPCSSGSAQPIGATARECSRS